MTDAGWSAEANGGRLSEGGKSATKYSTGVRAAYAAPMYVRTGSTTAKNKK